MSEETQYFTLIFKGNLRNFPTNPHKVETPFGTPVASGVGHAFNQIDRLLEEIDDCARSSTG